MAVRPNKVAMVILVKNEIDIIELNIRFHRRMGIEYFVIMDNGSIDGTLERLKELKQDFNIHLVENPDGVYRQSQWMTELARLAAKKYRVTHVIPNDADEFWLPTDYKNLPAAIDGTASVQTVHRFNRVLTREQIEQDIPYHQSEYFVESPILYTGETQQHQQNISMQLVKISPKVIVQPKGLIKIKGGNHRADHWFIWKKTKNPSISVHHFPIRSYKQFKTNIENRANILDKPNVKMGPHYRRWVKQFLVGDLPEEFQRLALNAEQLKVLEELGVVTKDNGLAELLAEIVTEIPKNYSCKLI